MSESELNRAMRLLLEKRRREFIEADRKLRLIDAAADAGSAAMVKIRVVDVEIRQRIETKFATVMAALKEKSDGKRVRDDADVTSAED